MEHPIFPVNEHPLHGLLIRFDQLVTSPVVSRLLKMER
jgi:hypothetical protein